MRSQACDTPFLAPETSRERQMLAIEAQYYLLPGLVAYLNQIVVDEDMSALATHGGNRQQVVEYIQVSGKYRTYERYCKQSGRGASWIDPKKGEYQQKITNMLSTGYFLHGNLEYRVVPFFFNLNCDHYHDHFMMQAMVKYA